jgi:hypothetical protein
MKGIIEFQTIDVKVMAQSCVNTDAQNIILDLEKKINSLCKGASLITIHFLKKMFF